MTAARSRRLLREARFAIRVAGGTPESLPAGATPAIASLHAAVRFFGHDPVQLLAAINVARVCRLYPHACVYQIVMDLHHAGQEG